MEGLTHTEAADAISATAADVTEELQRISRRPDWKTLVLLNVAAGGRCEFYGCNKYLYEHPVSLSEVNLSENAHIYAFSRQGPRGDEENRPADIHSINNLILVCGDCHKEIDKNKGRYSIEHVMEHKLKHEERIKYATSLGPSARTAVVVLKGRIGKRPTDISFDEIRDAVDPRYPTDRQGFIIDLTELGDEDSSDYYDLGAKRIQQKMEAFYERGIDGTAPTHVSAFGMAVIPLLVQFGRCLSDKVELELFQRQHNVTPPWRWQSAGEPARYEQRLVQEGDLDKVALMLSLSGPISRSMLPAGIDDQFSVYEIRLASEEPHRQFLRQRCDLEVFRTVYEAFFAELVRRHPDLRELHVFPAVPAPVAIICGHTMLPKKHPTLLIYDKVAEGDYVFRLKVK
jgi:hypothetical protein